MIEVSDRCLSHRMVLDRFLIVALAGFVVAGLVALIWAPARPPALNDFLSDNGYHLAVTRGLLQGQTLYRDIAWEYGPLPILPYTFAAYFFGNTPTLLLIFRNLQLLGMAFLTFFAVRRFSDWRIAAVTSVLIYAVDRNVLGVLIYHYVQVSILLLLIWAWRPPPERSFWQCLGYGTLLGLLQTSKFGYQFTVGTAFLLVEGLWICGGGWRKDDWIAAWKSAWLILAGYLSFLVIYALILLSFLPPVVAGDVLWPVYLTKLYTFVRPEWRYPHLEKWYYVLSTEIPAAVGLIILVLVLAQLSRAAFRSRPVHREAFPYALLLAPLTYAVSIFVLYRQKEHFYVDAAMAALAFPLVFYLSPRWLRLAAGALVLPALVHPPFEWIHSLVRREAPLPTLTTPSRVVVAGPTDQMALYRNYFDVLQEKCIDGSSVAILAYRPGVVFLSGLPAADRHLYYYLHCSRDWEENRQTADFLHCGAIALYLPVASSSATSPPTPKEKADTLALFFTPKVYQPLLSRLIDPVYLGIDDDLQERIWVFSLAK